MAILKCVPIEFDQPNQVLAQCIRSLNCAYHQGGLWVSNAHNPHRNINCALKAFGELLMFIQLASLETRASIHSLLFNI